MYLSRKFNIKDVKVKCRVYGNDPTYTTITYTTITFNFPTGVYLKAIGITDDGTVTNNLYVSEYKPEYRTLCRWKEWREETDKLKSKSS